MTAASDALRKLTTKSLGFLIKISLVRKFAHLRYFGKEVLKHVYDNLQLINNLKCFLALMLKIMFASMLHARCRKGKCATENYSEREIESLRVRISFVIERL